MIIGLPVILVVCLLFNDILGLPGFIILAAVLISATYVVDRFLHIQLIPANVIKGFTQEKALRKLCRLYRIDDDGTKAVLKERLIEFVEAQRGEGREYIWVNIFPSRRRITTRIVTPMPPPPPPEEEEPVAVATNVETVLHSPEIASAPVTISYA